MDNFKIYDIETDNLIPLTQQRLELLEWVEQAYGAIRVAYQREEDLKEAIEKAHERLKEHGNRLELKVA